MLCLSAALVALGLFTASAAAEPELSLFGRWLAPPAVELDGRKVFGRVERGNYVPGYHPEFGSCGSGKTCTDACGADFEACNATTSLSLFCYSPKAKQTCCPNGSGRACEDGYYCAWAEYQGRTFCCKNGQSLVDCGVPQQPNSTISTLTRTERGPTATTTSTFTTTKEGGSCTDTGGATATVTITGTDGTSPTTTVTVTGPSGSQGTGLTTVISTVTDPGLVVTTTSTVYATMTDPGLTSTVTVTLPGPSTCPSCPCLPTEPPFSTSTTTAPTQPPPPPPPPTETYTPKPPPHTYKPTHPPEPPCYTVVEHGVTHVYTGVAPAATPTTAAAAVATAQGAVVRSGTAAWWLVGVVGGALVLC